jgi:hypothetical protein
LGLQPETGHWGSVIDVPLVMAVTCDREWWWGGVYEVVVVLHLVTQAGQWIFGLKPETELLGLSYRCTVGNSCGGPWGKVVGWGVWGSGGVVVVCLVAQVAAAAFGLKARNQADRARFWVRRWSWWWWGGAYYVVVMAGWCVRQHEAGVRVGLKI